MESGNRVLQIRRLISDAIKKEAQSPSLDKVIADRHHELHKNIDLPADNPEDTLCSFVTRYVELVPDCIDTLNELGQRASIYDFASIFIDTIEGYFIDPPKFLIAKHCGFAALIDEAYLAFRLIEEVNDRMMMMSNIPLIPMDMTVSNLIIHDIIGETFANKLDSFVLSGIESIITPEKLQYSREFINYVVFQQNTALPPEKKHWPCFAWDSCISLKLTPVKPQTKNVY